MTISFPRTDIMTLVDYSADTQPPQLVSRQELSRLAGGKTIGKDLGPAYWLMNFVTKPLQNDDAVEFEAIMDSLDGVVHTFEAFDFRRINPRAYPTGSCNDGVLLSVNANNKALALSGLAAGQIVSRGDYLSFDYAGSRALHRAAESVTANGFGVTAQFEVRPHIRLGYTFSPATPVTLKNPRGVFSLMPGSFQARASGALHTVVSFQAFQALS